MNWIISRGLSKKKLLFNGDKYRIYTNISIDLIQIILRVNSRKLIL
jgi:hypothetical protein